MAVQEISVEESTQVNGGVSVLDAIEYGAGGMSLMGIVVTNTARGAATGGAIGAAGGFAFGLGWGLGSQIYDSYVSDWFL